jgi:hypothetical protein
MTGYNARRWQELDFEVSWAVTEIYDVITWTDFIIPA